MQRISAQRELRHLSGSQLRPIEQLLDVGDNWKKFILVIPKQLPETLDDQNVQNQCPLISASAYELLEQQKFSAGSAGHQLLSYWSTYGRKRPTVKHLIFYLQQAGLERIAHYVKENLVEQPLSTQNFINLDSMAISADQLITNNNENSIDYHMHGSRVSRELSQSSLEATPPTPTMDVNVLQAFNNCSNDSMYKFTYEQLAEATNNFDETPVAQGGRKLGEGGFGAVYLAKLSNIQTVKWLAVKKLRQEFATQLSNELRLFGEHPHPRILPLLGLTLNGEAPCLLYEYMPNGSLQERIKDKHVCLIPSHRILLAIQIAEALVYLHERPTGPLVHRDVKSANVLLDQAFEAKLGDFGLARIGNLEKTGTITQNIIGTSVYMAPEAFKGDISVKLDTFSFGVILLELLTGLSPFCTDRDPADLLAHVSEQLFESDNEEEEEQTDEQLNLRRTNKMLSLLDEYNGKWNHAIACRLFDIAKNTTLERKKKRPTMSQVLKWLKEIQ